VHFLHLLDVTGFFGGRPTCIYSLPHLHFLHLGPDTRNEEREERKKTWNAAWDALPM
jgi:hypothetical protein